MSVQEYLEPAVKDFADQAKATYSAQLDPQTFMGKQYVAGEDPLQTQAINLAQQGVGSYTPYLNMAQLVPGLYGQDVQSLQGAGTNQQLQEQNILDQQREANRMAAYEPYERLGYMGAGMGNVMGGAMGQYQTQVSPNKSPLETALGIASLGYGMTK
jgi:hypothetical protein